MSNKGLHLLCGIEPKSGQIAAFSALVIIPQNLDNKTAQEYLESRMSSLDPLVDFWYVGGAWNGLIQGEKRVWRSYNFSGEFGQWEHNTIECSKVCRDFLPFALLSPETNAMWAWEGLDQHREKLPKDWHAEIWNVLNQYPRSLAVSVYVVPKKTMSSLLAKHPESLLALFARRK